MNKEKQFCGCISPDLCDPTWAGFSPYCAGCRLPIAPKSHEAVENGRIPSSDEKWVEEAASLCSHKTCTEVCDNIILIRSLLAAEREELIKRAIEGLPKEVEIVELKSSKDSAGYLLDSGFNHALKAVRAGLEKLRV